MDFLQKTGRGLEGKVRFKHVLVRPHSLRREERVNGLNLVKIGLFEVLNGANIVKMHPI